MSERAVAGAFEEAALRSAPLVVVRAWMDVEDEGVMRRAKLFFTNTPEEDEVRALLDEQLAGWEEKYPGVSVERVVVRDRPRRCDRGIPIRRTEGSSGSFVVSVIPRSGKR